MQHWKYFLRGVTGILYVILFTTQGLVAQPLPQKEAMALESIIVLEDQKWAFWLGGKRFNQKMSRALQERGLKVLRVKPGEVTFAYTDTGIKPRQSFTLSPGEPLPHAPQRVQKAAPSENAEAQGALSCF